MAEIVAHLTNLGVPLTAPGTAPTIRIRRTDTGALVVTDAAMTELGGGSYVYTFATTATLQYVFRVDADPAAAGQVSVQERYKFGSLSGITVARVETDIPAILAAIAALNDLSAAEAEAACDASLATAGVDATLTTRLTLAYRLLHNKMEIDEDNDRAQLYDDAGVAVILTIPLTDKAGNTLILPAGVPYNRGVPT